MRVRAAYTEKRRQMKFTRRQFPAALNLKAIIKLDSGIYYGNTGKNARPVGWVGE
ncbi:Uncharacterised protein [Citrobacter braakii]|uniref:hypothetical protein n=1 Tax=Citrobacter braakii TaxID=57706 RepID=UPI000E07131C|nr:hypothetical protein [Citrobacter braakii]STJ26709.1 Uncharacterised protein [Citrobacter braakii]